MFGLAVRQTEGLIGSILLLFGLDLSVPDHSTMTRRARSLRTPGLRPHRMTGDGTGVIPSLCRLRTTRLREHETGGALHSGGCQRPITEAVTRKVRKRRSAKTKYHIP